MYKAKLFMNGAKLQAQPRARSFSHVKARGLSVMAKYGADTMVIVEISNNDRIIDIRR